jgi:hypothetical protein
MTSQKKRAKVRAEDEVSHPVSYVISTVESPQ